MSEEHGREREHSEEDKDGQGYEQETSEAGEHTEYQGEPQEQEYSTTGALHNIVRWIRNRFG